MKENKAFRILFITKKQLKSRQGSHRMFLKPQYKVYRGVSILYFNTSFSDVLSISKISHIILNFAVIYEHFTTPIPFVLSL